MNAKKLCIETFKGCAHSHKTSTHLWWLLSGGLWSFWLGLLNMKLQVTWKFNEFSVKISFNVLTSFWSQDPYNRYVVVFVVLVVVGTHSKILLELSQNWKLSKVKVAKNSSCQNWSCQIWMMPKLKVAEIAKIENC